jgi:DNA invertase Pin-like site-specific DNA recombinase
MVERVKAGLRNARAKGKHLGRPKRILDRKRIDAEMGVGVGTLYRVVLESCKIREEVF